MGTIIVTEFMTADGVVADPHLWSFPYWGEQIGALKHEELFGSEAKLLGRVTYDGFAEAWPGRAGDEFADRINSMPKYVVSNTLDKADWENTTVLRTIDDVRALKVETEGTIVVDGSVTLVQALIAADLVDEYHLLVYPLVRGEGLRLFQPGTTTHLDLVEVRDMGKGVIAQHYRRANAPAPVSYDDIMGKN